MTTANPALPALTIRGWGIALPSGRLTNADLEQRLETRDAWIVERTGIRERRYAMDGETTASLASAAGHDAIKRAGLEPADIDLLIIATCTPEQTIPHTGSFVGETLGLRCGSFDLNAACSGFVYALVLAQSMLSAGHQNILVIGAETLSHIVNPSDRSTLILFGDGAGAAVVSPATEVDHDAGRGVLAWDLGCDGTATSFLGVTAGGSRVPTSAESVANGDHYIHMHGQEVFKRAVRAIVDSATATLQSAAVSADDVAWFVPHQANLRIIESATKRLGIPAERTVVNLERYGNTSSASIPLALFEAADDGRISDGDLVLISGCGAGMTWASMLLRWGTSHGISTQEHSTQEHSTQENST